MSYTDTSGTTYTLNMPSAGEATISQYGSASGNVIIPPTVTSGDVTYTVTSVNSWCSWGSATGITFPEGFTTLNNYSVHDVQTLKSVTFPSTITSFGNNNFTNCINLEHITFSEGITSLNNYLFTDCTSLARITLPATLTTIGSYLFSGCISLRTVTFLGNLPSKQYGEFNNIAAGAVGYYSGTGWSANSFPNLPMLPESARPVYPTSIVDYNKPTQTVVGSSTVINFNFIPLTGGAVTEYKLFNSTDISRGTPLTSSATSPLSYSFTTLARDTTMSFYVIAYNNNDVVSTNQSLPISIDINGFLPKTYNYPTNSDIYVRYNLNSRTLTASIPNNNNYATGVIVIPATLDIQGYTFNVTTIDSWAITSARTTSLTFPEGFTTISNYAIHDVSTLTSITFPSTITSFGNNIATNCINLTNITFSEGITQIGNSVFPDCTSLESITFPASLTRIGSSIFTGCTSLSTVTFLGNLPLKQSGEFANIAANAVGYYNPTKSGWGSGGTGIIANLNMQALPNTVQTALSAATTPETRVSTIQELLATPATRKSTLIDIIKAANSAPNSLLKTALADAVVGNSSVTGVTLSSAERDSILSSVPAGKKSSAASGKTMILQAPLATIIKLASAQADTASYFYAMKDDFAYNLLLDNESVLPSGAAQSQLKYTAGELYFRANLTASFAAVALDSNISIVRGNTTYNYPILVKGTAELYNGTTPTVSGGGSGSGGSPVPCLPTGQRILTANGWRAVETLRRGDMVITDKGTAVPATIYSSTIKTTAATAPITIPANLFGRNAPSAPIRLSPMHAVRMTKNVWEFPYNLLDSRDGVTQDAPGASVTYYHIALPNFLRDNMVLEGGVVAESFGAPYAKANGLHGIKFYTYSERLGGYTRIGEGSIKKTA